MRLVQLLGHNGVSWSCIADSLKQLPGPVLEFTQQAACPEDLSEALERYVLYVLYTLCVLCVLCWCILLFVVVLS